HGFEAANFFVDIFALRRIGRAQNDQEVRGFERGERLLGKRVAGRKIFAVAKNRPQRLWDGAGWGALANQILIDPVAFKCAVQPLAPSRVTVAVAQKRAILEASNLCHALSPSGAA